MCYIYMVDFVFLSKKKKGGEQIQCIYVSNLCSCINVIVMIGGIFKYVSKPKFLVPGPVMLLRLRQKPPKNEMFLSPKETDLPSFLACLEGPTRVMDLPLNWNSL